MNTRIFILAVLFGIAETAYFGWNVRPMSDAELICDGITTLILAMAFCGKCARKVS